MDRLAAITLKPSRIALCLHIFVCLLALLAVGLTGLSWILKIVLGAGMLLLGYRYMRKQQHVQALGYEQGAWWVRVNGKQTRFELSGEQIILPWLVVINSLVLWPDSADVDDLRRLRVFMRYHKHSASQR